MTVDRSKTPHLSEYKGRTVFFCSAGCRATFEETPERYVDPAGRQAQSLQYAGRNHSSDRGVAIGQEPPEGEAFPSVRQEWSLKITSDSWRTVATVWIADLAHAS
jgi:YHS domain-containing protein